MKNWIKNKINQLKFDQFYSDKNKLAKFLTYGSLMSTIKMWSHRDLSLRTSEQHLRLPLNYFLQMQLTENRHIVGNKRGRLEHC